MMKHKAAFILMVVCAAISAICILWSLLTMRDRTADSITVYHAQAHMATFTDLGLN